MRSLLLFLAGALTLSCGSGRPSLLPAGAECVSYDASRKTQASLEAANDERYRRSLAELGFETISLNGWAAERRQDDGEAEWTEKSEDRGGKKVRVLVGPRSEISCGERSASKWPFARNAKGELYYVVQHRRAGASKTIYVCGCLSDVPITCGGAAPEPVQWYFELPEGTTFRGSLPIEMVIDTAFPSFVGRADGKECPEPVAPP